MLGALAGPAQAAQGDIFTFAGTGAAAFGGDGGPATSATLRQPTAVAWLADGSVLVADYANHRIRRISPSGQITTVAGTGTAGYTGDGGPATSARLNWPLDVEPTADGGFLIADLGNKRVRRVSPAGIITTVAGTGADGTSGDGGPATSARLSCPDRHRGHHRRWIPRRGCRDAPGPAGVPRRDDHEGRGERTAGRSRGRRIRRSWRS